MSTQITNADGTETDLIEHLGDMHQKGTKGFTDEYLASLHNTLHQRKRDPLPEHSHPEPAPSEPASSEPAPREPVRPEVLVPRPREPREARESR